MNFTCLRLAASAALVAAVVACASAPKPPARLSGSIRMSPQVNPNASQRPSPLMLRVYELKTVAAFNSSDFMSLYQRDQAELGGDLVQREEYVLAPGETKAFVKTLGSDTHFLGVVAAFRDLDRSKWRGVAAVDPTKNQQVVIQVEALGVAVSVTTAAK